jgi:undecaprenyl phosphate-alpha-L-ara4N flippase subunit ArnE
MTGVLAPGAAILLLFCVVADAGRELNFKAASLQADPAAPVATLFRSPMLWIGLLLWAVEVVAWILALAKVPLTMAFPVMALTYAVTPLAARFALGERLDRGQKAGAALVALGVLVVSLNEVKT